MGGRGNNEITIYPNPVIPLSGFVGGGILLCMAVFSATMALSFAGSLWHMAEDIVENDIMFLLRGFAQKIGIYDFSDPAYVILMMSIVAAIIIFISSYIYFISRVLIYAFGRISRALIQKFNSGFPEGMPERLAIPEKVEHDMANRCRYAEGFGIGKATAFFGLNLQYLSPAAMILAEKVFKSIGKKTYKSMARVFLCGALYVLAIYWLINLDYRQYEFLNVPIRILLSIGFEPALTHVIIPFFVLFSVISIALVLRVVFMRMITPEAAPSTDVIQKTQKFVAASSPNMIFGLFPTDMQAFGRAGAPNRVYSTGQELAAASVSDTGNFDFHGLIELQPEITDNLNLKAARFWLISGWFMVIFGCSLLLFFLFPSHLWSTIVDAQELQLQVFLTPIAQVLTLTAGWRAFRIGYQMVSEAEVLLDSFWSSSPAIAYRITGTTTKSELMVGKGVSDSLQTSSIIYRSEFLFSAYVCELIAESAHPSKPRIVVSMRKTKESDDLLGNAFRVMEKIVGMQAAPVSMDLGNDGVQNTVKANISIETTRLSAKNKQIKSLKSGK